MRLDSWGRFVQGKKMELSVTLGRLWGNRAAALRGTSADNKRGYYNILSHSMGIIIRSVWPLSYKI